MFKAFLRNKLHFLFMPLIRSDSDYLIVIAYSNLRYIYIYQFYQISRSAWPIMLYLLWIIPYSDASLVLIFKSSVGYIKIYQ